MEKHKCKLCFRSFSNGRALGGHMRSHMLNLPIPPKPNDPPPPQPQPMTQRGRVTESASSSSAAAYSTSEEEEEEEAAVAVKEAEEEDKGIILYYGLRENPKKSFRLADPGFSFAVDAAAATATSSVVLQDRESETESSKNHPTHRRRSKRTRPKSAGSTQLYHHHQYHCQQEQEEDATIITSTTAAAKLKPRKPSQGESSWAIEPEPVSSISDTTTEEDVAFCLMMLSRDKWSNKQSRGRGGESEDVEENDDDQLEKSAEEEDEETEDGFDSDDLKSCKPKNSKGKYRCETCKKLFKSYQALGGHRASHKKLKLCNNSTINNININNNFSPTKPSSSSVPSSNGGDDQVMIRSHQCPVCFRVFSSGQALGGHKRSHLLNQTRNSAAVTPTSKISGSGRCGDNLSLIDLNLPAPIEDDPEFELSAVSDAEVVNTIKG